MFGKVKIGWQGDLRELQINMMIAEEVDNEVNIIAAIMELSKDGIPRVTYLAKVFAVFLRHAGFKVSQEEVYASIAAEPLGAAELKTATLEALNACFPAGLDTPERVEEKKD